jgi:hypothetical protein
MIRTLALVLVLAAFSAYTAYALAVHGLVGFFEVELATPAGTQVLLDLVIACGLALVWMAGDARERGLPFWPYLALTLCLGSIGLLSYVIHRELRARAPERVTA